MKKYIVVIILTALAVVWAGFILAQSMETGEESSELSGQVCEVVNEVAQDLGAQEPISEHTIRKTAHFGEYMILGVILCADIVAINKVRRGRLLRSIPFLPISLVFAIVVAIVDEFVVQANTEGRGPAFTDVLIDAAGATTSILCFLLVIFVLHILARSLLKKDQA